MNSENTLAIKRALQRNIIILMLQYAGLMLTTLSSAKAPVWLASGSAAAFIFLRGPSILPGIYWGSALAFFMAGLPLLPSALAALVLSLQAWLLLKACYRSNILSLVFYNGKELGIFLVWAALLCSLSAAALSLICAPYWQMPSARVLHWALANFTGLILIGCPLYTWDAYFADIQQLKWQVLRQYRWCSLMAGLFLTGILAAFVL